MIVLDTHTLVWWIGNPKRLSATARRVVDAAVAANGALVSCISTWEVAMLSLRGRLELTLDVTDWLARVEALPYLRFVPVDNAIAVRSVLLPEPLHRDPADRIIIATALVHGGRGDGRRPVARLPPRPNAVVTRSGSTASADRTAVFLLE